MSGAASATHSATISNDGSGAPAPCESGAGWTWDRLERAVTTLAEQHQHLRDELRALRHELGQRDQRIRTLETQLLEANQRRQDTGKRIDELISQLDQLDAQLASVEPAE